ncbi:MAG: hypothetical protein JO144_02575, partial [Actinobacteria bacterium]|nr:hypothetical protein [Actinomycetota bacterium]
MTGPPPPARRRRTGRLVVAVLVVVVVALAGVAFALVRPHHRVDGTGASATPTTTPPATSSTPSSTDTSTASAPVTVASGGTVALPDGTSVDIAPGSVSTDTTVTLTHGGDSPALPSDGLSSAGQPVHIELAAGQLAGSASVSIPVTAPADTPDGLGLLPLLAYYDEDAGTWTAVEATYNSAAHTVTATVDHFSWWNPFTWNYSAIRDSIKQALADMAGIPSGIKPTCAHPAPASVATVTVTGASLLDYCLDDSNGALTLRTRSRPDFPLLLTWAGTSSLSKRTEYDIDITSIYLWLAKLLNVQAQNALGLPTGGMADLAVKPDSNSPVVIHATYEPRTQLIGIVDATVRVVLALRSVMKIATTAEEVVSDIIASSCLIQHTDDLASDPAGAFTTIVGDCVHDVIGELAKAASGLLRIAGA